MAKLVIDARDFLKGASVSDYLSDGGFSPSSKGVTLFNVPGLIKPGPGFAAVGTIKDNGMLAIDVRRANTTPYGKMVSSDTGQNGYFYDVDTSSRTLKDSDVTGKNYIAGVTDLTIFQSQIFVSSSTDITFFSDEVWTGKDVTWWTTTKGKSALNSGAAHLFVQYAGVLYFSDGRYLHSWDGTTATEQALDLPQDYSITALTVYNNLIYIAAERYNDNLTGTRFKNSKIFTWDGFSASFLDEFTFAERIDCMVSLGGTLMMTTPTALGYFTGNSFSPIYPLAYQVKKHQVGVTSDRMYMAQGSAVMCFGSPIKGKAKIISYPMNAVSGTNNGLALFYNPYIHISNGDTLYQATDFNSAGDPSGGTGLSTFRGNKYFFSDFVKINYIIVETDVLQSGDSVALSYIDSAGNTKTIGTLSYALDGAVYERRFNDNGWVPTRLIQPIITWNAGDTGFSRIIIDYDPAEHPTNK